MKNWVTKKNILAISSTFSLVLFLAGTIQGTCDYDARGFCWRYWIEIGNISVTLLIFFPLSLFSLITYRMRNEVFETWVKFALWWTSATVVLVLFAPANDPSLLPITKSVVALASTVALTVISGVLILWKRSMLKGGK
jgi:hypothetical protein